MLGRIAAVVKSVRMRANRSLEEVAAETALPVELVAALERGEAGISTTQLLELAESLELEPAALLRGDEVALARPSVFLRHHPMQDFDARDAPVLDDALEQGRALARLTAWIGRPPLALQASVFRRSAAASDSAFAAAQDGYARAREVRHGLGDPNAPLGDIATLAEERLGVAVVVRTFHSTRIDAASVVAESSAAIVLSTLDPVRATNPLLSRVHIAHELCHVLFDVSPGDGVQIVVDASVDRKTDAAERRAKAFAAELLLPLDGLTSLLGPARQIHDESGAIDMIARARSHFGAPHEITANHLCNRQFIDKPLREWLVAKTSPFVGPPPETRLPADGKPSRAVAQLTEAAHRDGVITDGEARSLLGLDRLAPLPWDEAVW